MRSRWSYAAIGLTACIVVVLWPLSPALSATGAFQARLYAVIVTVVLCVGMVFIKGTSLAWLVVSIVSGGAGVAALLAHFNAGAGCIAEYEGRQIVIGRTLNQAGEEYATDNPGLSSSDLLFDAAGAPERLWTGDSIRSCQFWLGWGGLTAIPLFATCVGGLIARRRFHFSASTAAPSSRTPKGEFGLAPVYDVFISYRHVEPDKTHACELLETLESHKLRAAIDFRDFRPNEHFLSEMERCIKQSRFVLCVVTAAYLDSDHCSEEAIISKTLDMTERRRRIVPLIFEQVELPVWLHGLVGIEFRESASVDPVERLIGLLSPPETG
jgi:hypothetical protein